ncbi:hypothetical protein JCM10213v2_006495 [Rhodosporidiobolus nylandii]
MLTSCLASLLPRKDSLSDQSTLCEKHAFSHVEGKDTDTADEVGRKRYSPLALLDAKHRLDGLRREMKDAGVDVYIVQTADAHGSEYASLSSALDGNGGADMKRAARYHTQATSELDPSLWSLQKVGLKGVKDWKAWLVAPEAENGIKPGSKVGVDAEVLDFETATTLSHQLSQQRGLSLVFPSQGNLVDVVWGDERPKRKAERIVDHPVRYAGISAQDKLATLRSWLSARYPPVEGSPTPSFLLTSLPPLAWLLNLRGSDIAFNPVFYGYCLVTPSSVILWVQGEALEKEAGEVRRRVREVGGELREYEGFLRDLEGLKEKGEKVVADGKVSWAVAQALGSNFLPLPPSVPNPVEAAQAIKNEVEIAGFRAAYLRDGVAWVRWLAWLEETLLKQKEEVTEWDAAEKLTEYRSEGEGFKGLAYENISATGENAALPHYAPSPDHPVPIDLEVPGAQYLDGTIDTTRTYLFSLAHHKRSLLSRLPIPFPFPGCGGGGKKHGEYDEYRRAFTRVLQGHIAIDGLVFPEGTTGEQVDVLARAALWREGMDYGHGTGHGLGAFLSVHETQVGISHSAKYFSTPFLPGHITSNEPAYYEPGSYGIRIESVVCVKEVETRRALGGKWYGFERLTVVPIQPSFANEKLMSPSERRWLKAHNKECVEKLLPLVQAKGDTRAARWLRRQVC